MKWLLLSILLIVSIIIIVPPIHYHYIYPNAGDDTASHLIYFQNMDKMQPSFIGLFDDVKSSSPLYYGQYLVGKLINRLPFDMNVTFLWFHYIVLIFMLWVIGLVIGITVNYWGGIFAVLLVIGVSEALNLFNWGQIFDLINIGIFLPLALLSLHNKDNNVVWKVLAIFSLIAFAYFHANGRYILALLPIAIVYEVIRSVVSQRLVGLWQQIWNNRFLVYTGFLGLALFALYQFEVGQPDPGRLKMDGSILLAIFLGGVLGLFFYDRSKILSVAVVMLAVLIAMPNIAIWLQYNNAIRIADKEAIAYLNSLDGRTYTASSQVAQEIYSLFINKEFQETIGADYVVVRTIWMTPRSDPKHMYFQNGDRIKIDGDMSNYGYKLLETFDNGEIDKLTGIPIVVSLWEVKK